MGTIKPIGTNGKEGPGAERDQNEFMVYSSDDSDTLPFELLVESGKTKIYWDLNQHGGNCTRS